MKSNVEEIDSLHKSISVELPWKTIAEEMNLEFSKLAKQVSIKGFRKGKVPKSVIKQRFGARVQEEVLGRMIADSYDAAIVQHRIQPVARPELDRGELKEGKDYKYTAKVEVKPEIELLETTFDIEKEEVKVTDKKVNEAIDQLRESKAVLVPVEGRDTAQKDDVAIIDYRLSIEGKPVDGGESKNYQLQLGSQKAIPGFEDQITGMKVGKQKAFDLDFPKDYGSKDVAGKAGHFDVTLTALKAREIPELNDEFVKDLGKETIKTVDDLKKDVKKQLLEEEEARVSNDAKQQIIDKLIEANPFPLPPSLVDRQQEAMVEEMQTYFSHQGVEPERLGLNKSKMKKELAEKAKREVQAALLLSKVAETEKIEIDDAAIDAYFGTIAERMGQNLASIKAVYDNPDRLAEIRYKLRQDKVLEFLLNKANINTGKAKKAETASDKTADRKQGATKKTQVKKATTRKSTKSKKKT